MSKVNQQPALAPDLQRHVGTVVSALARALALLGGLVLVLIAMLTVISVFGRALIAYGLGPVPGDYELVEAGCAFAVFAFLPWCQLQRAHATVDVFVAWASPRAQARLSLASNLMLTIVTTVVAWQLGLGLADKASYGETTFILQMPVWYGYAGALIGAAMFAVACAYTAWRSLNEALGAGERVS